MIRPLLIFLLALPTLLPAALVVEIWPEGKMPGEAATEPEAKVTGKDRFTRITNVSRPTLTLFPASLPDGKPAPAVIVCPGGGYSYTVMDKEGSEIAAWLNSVGITALVLKYRTPKNREGALQDAQRSIRLARSRAVEWAIDADRVGMIGFSAGGHVAARASTGFGTPAYAAIDVIDEQNARPDFAMLIYPAYLDDRKGAVSPELNLKAKIPPTLIVHTDDDKNHVIGSKVYDAAMDEAKVVHQFLLYPTGGHGYGMHCEGEASAWPADAAKWLREIGVN